MAEITRGGYNSRLQRLYKNGYIDREEYMWRRATKDTPDRTFEQLVSETKSVSEHIRDTKEMLRGLDIKATAKEIRQLSIYRGQLFSYLNRSGELDVLKNQFFLNSSEIVSAMVDSFKTAKTFVGVKRSMQSKLKTLKKNAMHDLDFYKGKV